MHADMVPRNEFRASLYCATLPVDCPNAKMHVVTTAVLLLHDSSLYQGLLKNRPLLPDASKKCNI